MFFICIVLSVFFTSCITQHRCNERYPPVISDSIRTWITTDCFYVHDTVHGSELTFDTSGVIPEIIHFIETQTKGRLTQTVIIDKGKLTAICNEQAYKDSFEIEKQTIHEKDTRKEILPGEPIRDGWYNFWKYLAIVSTSLLLICIGGLIYVK